MTQRGLSRSWASASLETTRAAPDDGPCTQGTLVTNLPCGCWPFVAVSGSCAASDAVRVTAVDPHPGQLDRGPGHTHVVVRRNRSRGHDGVGEWSEQNDEFIGSFITDGSSDGAASPLPTMVGSDGSTTDVAVCLPRPIGRHSRWLVPQGHIRERAESRQEERTISKWSLNTQPLFHS
jgi:hypothetical protein